MIGMNIVNASIFRYYNYCLDPKAICISSVVDDEGVNCKGVDYKRRSGSLHCLCMYSQDLFVAIFRISRIPVQLYSIVGDQLKMSYGTL
jgi:hypothetical protein